MLKRHIGSVLQKLISHRVKSEPGATNSPSRDEEGRGRWEQQNAEDRAAVSHCLLLTIQTQKNHGEENDFASPREALNLPEGCECRVFL